MQDVFGLVEYNLCMVLGIYTQDIVVQSVYLRDAADLCCAYVR